LAAISSRRADGEHQIDPGLRESIQFTRANLIDPSEMARYRGFDIVLLSQRADLFRRFVTPDSGGKPL
jgi:chemotaxis methyl-accepting protein methylase